MEENQITLTAFNVKTKQKDRPILKAVISKTRNGTLMVQGFDDSGDKLVTLVGKQKAMAVIAAGLATWATPELAEEFKVNNDTDNQTNEAV